MCKFPPHEWGGAGLTSGKFKRQRDQAQTQNPGTRGTTELYPFKCLEIVFLKFFLVYEWGSHFPFQTMWVDFLFHWFAESKNNHLLRQSSNNEILLLFFPFLFSFFFLIKRTQQIGCGRLPKLRWTFQASSSCLHCVVDEELAFSPWTQPRKGNLGWCPDGEVISNLWSLNPVSPPQVHYVCFMPIADLEDCHSRCHQAIYLFIKPGPWSVCSSNHQQKRKGWWNQSLATLQESGIYLGLAAIVAL